MDGQTNFSTNNNSFTVGLDLNLYPWLTPETVLPSIPSVNTLLAAPQLGVPALANQPLPNITADSYALAAVPLSVRTINTADRLFTPAAVNDRTFLASVAAPASSTPKYYAAASATATPTYSQPIHNFAIQAAGTVTFNGNSDLDGNPLFLTDDAFIYAEKGFSLNGNSILPVQRDVAGNPLKNSAGKSLLIDQALVVAAGYLQSNSNGSNNYTNLNPPQIIAKQGITIPNYADVKQQELTNRIPAGAATVTFNAQLNTINNEAQWQQKFPAGGTATQPKIVRVINGGLNIPTNVNLSNYVIIVDNGDINFKSNSTLNNVVLVATNGSINLRQTQAENISVLASGQINGNSSLSFKGKNLLATGAGDIVLNGVTTGMETSQNLRLVAQGQIILNGSVSARGNFLSKGTFSANGNSNIYGSVATLQNVIFNGNSTFTYANTGNSRPPSIPTIKLSPNSDTGKSNSDQVTSIITPVITETGDVGAMIKLADGNTLIGQATVGLDGYWQITTSPLIDGNHNLTASAIDSNGVTSPTSTPLQITIDKIAPILNWVQRPDSTPLIPGSKLSGSINGTGSSAASLSYQWDSRSPLAQAELSVVPITLNATGGFDQALDFTGISNGTHQLTLISTDLAGNTTTNTFNVQTQLTLDNIAPVITAGLVVDSGISSTDKITNISTIKGTVTDASAIAEFKAGFDSQTPANFKSVLANLQNGSFSFTKPDLEQIYGGVIPDGLHTLNLVAKDQYGNQSSIYSFSFTLDTTIPIPTLNLATGSDTGVIGDYRTKAATVNLTGKTEANAQVLLAGNATPITADAQGNFTFSNIALNPKANSFTVTTTDVAGNVQTYTQVIYRTSPPTAVSLSTPIVLENSVSSLLVGNLTTVDPDGIDNYGYSLVDNAGGRFQLVGDKILVANGSLLDFEANQQHQIQVRTTDSEGDSYLQTIAIDVKNANEAPTALNISKTVVAENVAAGSIIGALSSTDPDLGDNGSFSLVAGTGDTDNSAFTIVDRQLTINQSPDFEVKNNYSLRLRVTDAGGLSFDRVFNISVTDVNEAPVKIGLTSNAIAENSSNNAVIANLTTIDPDISDTATYSLIDDAQGRFAIVGNELRVANGSLLDFEANKEHQITISSKDRGGLAVTQTFTIQVTNVNEAPQSINLSNSLTPENTLIGSVIGNLATIDPDAGDTHTYSLIDGVGDGDNNAFTITNNQLRFQVSPDFEIKSNYALRVKTTDAGGLSIEKQLTVNITNVNEAPTKLILDVDRVGEGSPLGTLIGKLTSTDPDAGDTHVYSLIAGNGDQDNAKFSIAGGAGTIASNELRLNFVPDFETQSVYRLRVQTKDVGGLTWQQELTVNVLDLPENLPPTGIGLSNSSIAENSANNALIAKLNTTDPDAGNTHTYTLLNDAGGRFKLVGNELQVANGALLDFETATSHQIRVRTTDNGTPNLAYEQNLTIGVTNVNEAPLFSSQPILFANVGQPYSYPITTIDPDSGDSRQITANRPLPSWLRLVDNGNGTAQLSGNPGTGDLGFFDISLAVTDAAGIKSLQEFSLGLVTTLVEGTSFNKRLEIAVNVPATGGQLSFKLDPLQFDSSDLKGINDALEVSLVDAQGKSLVSTFQNARDAFFNWTEGESAVTGKSASYNAITGVVTLDLTGVKPGAAKLVFKLVNDDLDTTTSVRLTELVLSGTAPTAGLQSANLALPDAPTPIAPSFFNSATDVSPSIKADYHRTSFNAGSKELFASIALKNLGSYSISGSLVVVVNHITDPTVQVLNADGFTSEGLAYYTFKTIDGKLDPNQATPEQTLVFKNPNGVQFSYDLTVLAEINNAPVIKSQPHLEVISGKNYQYKVEAIDLDNDTLTYKLLTAPTGMTIDTASGQISWNTTNNNLGNHVISVEVKDGRGGSKQQTYNLAVIETPPNRPPIFTSIPEVDAYVNTLYQYDANAIDPDGDTPLSFTLINGPDGIKVNSTTGVVNWTPKPAIILGDTVIGRIGSPGENDEFLFNGNIGQKIYFDSLQFLGDFNRVAVKIYSPSGILIDTESFRYNDSHLLTLSENGNYKIVVDGGTDYTGNYGFTLIDPTQVPIAPFNEVIRGTLSTGNEDDLYRFTGSSGQKLFFDQISSSGGSLDWVLYGPSNQVIFTVNSFQDVELDLTVAGEYTLALRGSAGFAQVVNYAFSIVTPELKDFDLPLNQVVSGAISDKGGQNRYSFAGKAGQQLFFDALVDQPYLPFTLYDPTGRVLATFDNRTDRSPAEGFTFSIDGVYKIVVDGQGETTGNYKFRLLDKAQAIDLPLDTDITGTFDNGGFGSAGYRFTLNESRYLFFDGQGGNGLWNLYNTNGQPVTSQNMASNLELRLDAGDYFLVARGSGGGDLNYKFRVITPEFTVAPMTVGETITGAITEKGEQNTYTFSGLAGQQFFFDGLTNNYLTVKVLDPSGRQIYTSYAPDNRGPDSGSIFSTNGTYRLIVDGDDENIGSYKFRLLDKAQANQLSLDTDITGTFDNGGLGSVSYRFSLTESRYLFFDGQGGNGSWTLYNPSGQKVFDQNLQYNKELLLDAGDYFLVASGLGGGDTNYKFRVITPEFNVAPMTIGDIVSGALLEIGEQDTYTFSGNAGQQLFFDSLDSNPLSVRILDSFGIQISAFNANTDSYNSGGIVIPLTGTYKLVIDGAEESIGNYKFRFLDKAVATVIPLDTDILGTFDNGGLGSVGYRFAVTGSHRLFFDGQGGNGRLNLFAPNGQYLNSLAVADDLELWLEPGDYFLMAQGAGGGAVDFKFKIADRETRAAMPLVGTQLLLGAANTGAITAQGQKDTYIFNGVAGQQLFFDNLQAGNNYIQFHLLDAVGREIYSSNSSDLASSRDLIILATGTYRLVVDGLYGSNVGSYKFRLLDKVQATEIPLDTTITGTFDNGGFGSNGYRFSLSNRQYIFFDGQEGSGLWTVYGANGQIISSQNMNSNREQWLDAGDYFLVVNGAGGSGANYKFNIVTPDLNTTAMVVGNTIAGSLLEKGEQDAYTFSGTAGQQLFFDGLEGGNLSTQILDPTGRVIFSYDTLNDRGPDNGLTLALNGIYRVIVDGYDEGIGSYKFRLLDKAQANELPLDTDITGTFDNGGFGSVGYRFTLNDSRDLFFDGQKGAGSFNIYGLNGQKVSSQSLTNNLELRLDAGDYFLVASGIGSGDPNYKFRIITPEPNTTPVIVGNTISGNISEKGEQDTYTFTGLAGQQLFFLANQQLLDNSNYLTAKILDPAGKAVFSYDARYDRGLNNVGLILATNGNYRLIIDGQDEYIGSYKFRLLDKAQANAISLDADIIGTFDNGGLGSTGYKFSVNQGQNIYVDALAGNGNWAVYNPTGQSIASATFAEDREFWAGAGDYFLVVVGQSASSTNYQLRLVTSEFKTTAMNIGELISASISKKGEQDYYTFTGKIGQRIMLDELSPISARFAEFKLIGPSGKEVLSTYLDTSDETQPFTLTETGSYRIVVDGYFETVGNYSFRLLDLEDATSLQLDTNISGQLIPGTATQLYKFSGTADSRFYLDSLSNIPNTGWVLYGAGNQIIAQSNSFSDLEVVLPKNDIYFLAIKGNNSTPVDYQFRAIPIEQSVTELSLGQLVSETILKKGEQDTYSFSGQIGQKLFFDVVVGINSANNGTASGIHGRLYSPTGILVADLLSGNSRGVTLTEKGTYKVIVDGDGDITGNYSFLLSDRSTATKLLLNEPTNGQLAANGTPQLFSIKVNVGQFLRFDINDTDANKVNWILYGDGNQVLKQSIGQASDFDLMLPSSGVYSLAVFNRGTAQTNYQFTVTDITPAQVATTGLDTLIGETAFSTRSGQITAGQVVEQTFTASAGKRIFLDSLDFDDNNVTITILNPNGTTLLSTSASQDAVVTQLSQSGTYKIVVKGTTPTSGGDYRFSVFEVLTEAAGFNDDVRKLSLNAEVTKTLDYGRSTHVLSFQGNVGQRLFYDGMLPDGLGFSYANVDVRLIGPNGENIFEINQSSLYNRTAAAAQDAAPFILNSSGTYNLMIIGNQDVPATYRFKMWDLAGAEPLKLNKSYGDNLQRGSDTKFYKIQGEAGKNLYFDAIAGRNSDQWILYRLSDAKAVAGAYFTTDFEYVMPDNGEYVLAVRGDSTSPNSYQFQVTSTKDATAILVPGDGEKNAQEDEGLATFSVKLQVDDLKGGTSFQNYKIRLNPEEGNAAPVIISEAVLKGFFNRVYTYDVEAVDVEKDSLVYGLVDAPSGMVIDSGTGQISWRSPIAGEHQVKVRVSDTAGGQTTQIFTVSISGAVNGLVEGNVYNDLDKNGDRKITNPNNLTPYAGVEIGDRFKTNYTPYSLGLPNGLPGPVGPMVFLPGDPDTILIGGGIASCGGSIYKVKVLRGEGGHIIGFDDDANPDTPYVAEFYRYAPYLTGIAYAPDGSLITTNLKSSPFGGIGFVPEGIAGAGQLKSTGTWPNTGFYSHAYLGNGQFNNSVQSGLVEPGAGSFVYRPNTAFNFEQGAEVLITDPQGDRVLAYELDSAGNPIFGSQDVFLKDLDLAVGAVVDPFTGDILFSSAGQELTDGDALSGSKGTNTILAVRGLGPLTGNEPGLAGNIVYVDSDKDGVRDVGEEYTTTDANGKYSFTLAAGNYQIRQELSLGWKQTEPIDPIYREVNIVANKIVTSIDFGNFGLPANAENVAPKIVSVANLKAISEEKYLYQVKAVDLNGDALAYELVLKPEGMGIAENGTVYWKPGLVQVGSHRVVVRVSDNQGGIDLQTFDVIVQQGNSAPIITSVLPVQKPQVGKEFQYQVTAQDLDGDTLSYGLLSNSYQPIGVSIDPQTGVLKWTPTAAQLGGVSVYGDFKELVAPWQVIVKVTDGKGGEAYQSLDLIVDALKVNAAPVINSTPRQTMQLGSTYFYAIDATDPNGDRLTYSLVNPPAGMTIKDGLISWTPTAVQSGNNSVTVKVSDGSLTTTQSFELLVTNQAPNYAPQISSVPTLVTSLEQAYSYDLKGSDPDGDLVLWSLATAPEGMVIDVRTGALRWQPVASQIGEHSVAVRLVDSYGAYTVQEFVVLVNGINTPSEISSIPLTKAAIGQAYSYLVEATDPEGDELRYVLAKHPVGMKINGITGQISWTPVAGQVGRQEVDVQVIDGQGAVATQVYRIEVDSSAATVNLAPTISSQPIFGADAGTKYQYQVVAKDPENGALTYSLVTAPGGMSIDGVTGLITWDSPVIGSTQVLVKVTDSNGLGVGQGYTLTTRQNHAPVINSTPLTKVVVGNSYRYDVVAQDVDGDALTYSVDDVSKGLGVSIDPLGRISWKPSTANIGNHEITVKVADGVGGVGTQVYQLEVAADSVAPTINLVSGTNVADIGEKVFFQVQGTDNVGISNRQLLVNNQAITLDANGVGSYTVTAVGVVNVKAIVTDANGNITTSNTTINVVDPTDIEAPVVNLTFPTNITGITNIVGSITDTNLSYYVLEVALAETGDYKEVFRGTGNVTNGVLGKFDPTNLPNDTYTLRLTAFDTSGKGTAISQDVSIAGELKLGNFKLSFTDIAVPVAGVPITLTRTYDSLTSKSQNDFGYGWRMEFRDTNLRTSLKQDELYEYGGIRSIGFQDGDRVYVTLPGGKREGFTFRSVQLGSKGDSAGSGQLNGILGGALWKPNFEADQGNSSTLTVPDNKFNFSLDPANFQSISGDANLNGLLLRNSATGKLTNLAGRPYRPEDQGFGNQYILKTKDGTVYKINATDGKLESIKDTNGNTLNYTDTEIRSSNGQKVVFERDNQGRIVSVTDPLGAKIKYEYDAKGDLVAVTDRDGNTTKYEYNSTQSHYLDKIIDPLGREAVKTEYDAQGKLKKTTNVTGGGVEFVYDPENSIQVIKDALGNATTYEYDARGSVVRVVDPMGATTRMEYDDENNLIKSIDPNNLVTVYTYDNKRNVLSRSETYCGCPGVVPGSTSYTYNKYGQQTSVTLPTGATLFQDYDSRGNLLALRDGKGSVILSYTYDDDGNVLSETSEGSTSKYKYDLRGNVIETIDADGTITKTEYDANNRLVKMIEADGSISNFTYDTEGRQTKADYGNGLFVNYTYTSTSPDWTVIEGPTIGRIERKFTADGKLGGWVTPDGNITFTYDAAGRLWKETQPDGRTTEYTYDAAGRVIQTKDLSTGATATKAYNIGGQLLSETDSLGRTTSFTYDRNGKVASTTNPLGQTYTYVYAGSSTTIIDPLGRKTTSTNNDYYLPSTTTFNNGSKTSVEYLYTNNLQEAKDYPTRVVDVGGRVRTYGYDADGNLTTTTDLAGKAYTYKYGNNGVSDITSPTGAKINYEYDDQGNLTKLSYGTQVAKQYTYDADGKVATVTSASGEKITNAYDSKGNITGQTVTNSAGTSTSTTAYDADGRVSTLTNSTGTTGYLYDANGYVSQITSANGSIISYEHDVQGRITQQTEKANSTAVGLITKYSYDILGNLLTVTDSRNRVTTMTYDVVNRMATKTLPNGVKTIYSYDDLDRIINLTYTKANGTVLVSETYTRNAGGEPSKVLREDGSYTLYEYDSAVRLSKEVVYNPAGGLVESIEYSYDLDGKRTKKVDAAGTHNYNYNANGQLAFVGQDSYVYDVDGRLSQFNRDSKTVVLSHDSIDHLTQVSVNGVNTQYLYDAQGNRIGEVSGSNTKNYLVAPNLGNGLESTDLVTDGNGNVVSDYVYGGSSIIARLDANGEPIYYLTDSMGSVIGLVDGNGDRVSRIIYDGFGEVKSGDDGTSLGGDFRFQGQWLETESGLYYMRARDYDAKTGLFLSRDGVDVQQQSVEAFNLYQFAYNNPFIYSDPSGLFTISELNVAQVISDILDSLKVQAPRWAIDEAKGIVTNVLLETMKTLLPFSDRLNDIAGDPKQQKANGSAANWEDLFIENSLCPIVPDQYRSFIWKDPNVSTSGIVNDNGVPCGKYSNIDLGDAKPDFIIKNGEPTNMKTKGFLIGDLKLNAKSIKTGQGDKQFNAMVSYASKNNGYQYVNIATYLCIWGDAANEEKVKEKALNKGTVFIIFDFFGAKPKAK
jgi:RHS repeat-associated protein